MAAKTPYIIIGAAALIYLLKMNKTVKAFAGITKDNLLRGCDPLGCGEFGASRSGGTRTHLGIDFRAIPGEAILAPISGTVTRFPIPYANDNRYKGIEIKNDTYLVKMFYLSPTVQVNSKVIAGQKIGIAQDISAKHGSAMINHVHFEVYKDGKLIDPTNMIPSSILNSKQLLKKGMYDSPEVKELQRGLGITIDGHFGPLTENVLFAKNGVKEITLSKL